MNEKLPIQKLIYIGYNSAVFGNISSGESFYFNVFIIFFHQCQRLYLTFIMHVFSFINVKNSTILFTRNYHTLLDNNLFSKLGYKNGVRGYINPSFQICQ